MKIADGKIVEDVASQNTVRTGPDLFRNTSKEERTMHGTNRTYFVIKHLCTLYKEIVISWFCMDGE